MLLRFQVKFFSGRRNCSSFASLSGPKLEAGVCLQYSAISSVKALNKLCPSLVVFQLLLNQGINGVSQLERVKIF
jgi:hypothetical protein